MSTFKKCQIYDKYDFIDKHKCPPKYKIFHEEYLGDNFKTIYAYDYEEAAEKYGESWDEDDYTLLNGDEIEIQIEPYNDGERKTFIVSGRTEPVYYAKEKK